jgi:HAD superfamily hydrolase (TIGR01549 family)
MSFQPERVQGLCFDIDGTLRDTDDEYVHKLSTWLDKLKFLFPKINSHKTSRRLVMGLETPAHFFYTLLDWLTIDDEIVNFETWLHDKRILKPQNEFLIISGIESCLSQLSKHFPMAVVSARGERGTMAFLDHFNLSHYFKCIATGQTVSRTKPQPDPVLWAANQIGLSPENCLMIGDTTVDIRAGRAAGAQTIGVLSGFGHEHELKNVKADLIINSVSELPEILTP